tara:strand:+ start:173 stop:1171 length:999 start_codon:yes stop_codon:yes gene_type:complete
MTVLYQSDKYTKVESFLKTLEINKHYNIGDIVETILQIQNFKSKTLKNFGHADPKAFDPTTDKYLKDLWVDLTYQRAILLTKIVRKITKQGESSPTGAGFNDAACGRVDTALRPSGTDFVWDGLRRCIKAGLCGRDYVSVTTTNHKPHFQDIDCQRAEALWFKIRNSDFESMKPEEVWRSQVVYGDEDALRILTLLKNANLNLEQQNPNGIQLGGFAELRDNFLKGHLDADDIIDSSMMIQRVYKQPTVSVYLLCGLAHLITHHPANQEIEDALVEWVKINSQQKSLTSKSLKNKTTPSIAYYIATRVLKNTEGLAAKLGLDDEEIDMVENS